MDIDEITMHLRIRDALARYCHGADHGDLAMARSAYWPEAVDQHGGAWDGNGLEFVEDLQRRQAAARADGAPTPGTMHHLTSILVQPSGPEGALVQSYFVVHIPYAIDGQERLGLIVGRYLDRFERRGDDWRILHRQVVNDFTRADHPGSILGFASWQEGGFLRGGFGTGDPGVAFFATALES